MVKNCCVAARALTAAILAGGKGSLSLPVKAGRRTFCRVEWWRCGAILPRHTAVLVLNGKIDLFFAKNDVGKIIA